MRLGFFAGRAEAPSLATDHSEENPSRTPRIDMTRDLNAIHTPVLLDRTLELLAPALERDEAVFVDATLGMGGHSEAVLERFANVRVIGIDRDPEARAIAAERLARFGDRVRIVAATYDELDMALGTASRVDAMLFDLGVSSLQLDEAERGFAYAQDAPLDMRMNPEAGETAADLIARMGENELRDVFSRYGEEKLASRYARAIVASRTEAPIERSGQLVAILQDATPAALKNAGHPAKRVFQALRIAVNQELEVLERAIPAALSHLAVGGRIVVMSYHSLEDRIVKREFVKASTSKAPAGLAFEPEHLKAQFRIITRGAETASDAELAENPRSKPARLRAVERIAEAA